MIKLLGSLLLLVVLVMSCDEQMIPIPAPPVPTDGRVLLIEDLTGVDCVPCFGAAAFLEAAIDANEGSIIVYGIHGNVQSNPIDGSKYDFRYPAAAELEGSFNLFGKPSAAFNRIDFSASSKLQFGPAPWPGTIDSELQKPLVSQLDVFTDYDPVSRRVDIEVAAIPVEGISGQVNIYVVVTESHLIDAQKSPDGIVPDFEHNHVMKESLTGLQGAILGTDLVEGDIYKYDISYSLPPEVNGEWIAEHMEVVAFITAADRSGEVQQAAKAYFVE